MDPRSRNDRPSLRLPSARGGRNGNRPWTSARRRAAARAAFTLALLATATGCEYDSWLDPSVVGRWEDTPTVIPIVDKIDTIEDADDADLIETSPVVPADLIPEPFDYIVGPGDLLFVSIFELFAPEQEWLGQVTVTPTGTISVPFIGPVNVSGMTERDIEQAISDALDPEILKDPTITVTAQGKQQNTYNVHGFVAGPGRYPIPQPRFLLLDAMAVAQGIPETASRIYVIRQIPLSDDLVRGVRPVAAPVRPGGAAAPGGGDGMGAPSPSAPDDLERLIEDIFPEGESPAADPVPGLTPEEGGDARIDVEGFGEEGATPPPMRFRVGEGAARGEGGEPTIDVPTPTDDLAAGRQSADWVYLDGRWMQVTRPTWLDGQEITDEMRELVEADFLVTQRVIEIPVKPLLDGDARYNIVIRPNDIIRIPAPQSGVFYMGGQINRPGSFNLPPTGRMTLTRAIITAGGLGPLAVPDRVDVIRIIGRNGDRQIIKRLNLRAIYEGTEPDIFIKPDDTINIGTTWWAAPLAVIRNGFRASYGFGFLLDRNFGNDVFGAPPSNDNR